MTTTEIRDDETVIERSVLTEILIHAGTQGAAGHARNCAGAKFALKNRSLPARHPAWKYAPECNCWVIKVAHALKRIN